MTTQPPAASASKAPDAAADVGAKPPHAQLFEMLFGAWTAKILAEVVRLNVPDALARGALTAEELVERAGVRADPLALHRALRACAAIGVVSEDAVGRFGPTALSALLTRDAPGSLKRFVEYSGGLMWTLFTGLPEGLATGEPQARAQLGLPFFEYLAAHPQSLDDFAAVLGAHSAITNHGVLERYDFSGVRTLVDVGAGAGHLVIGVLAKYAEIRGTIFDLPEVIAAAPSQLPVTDPAVAERLTYVAGDMFADLPPADAYAFKLIFHDWDDASCARILARAEARLAPGGRLVCIDTVMPPLGDTSGVPSKLLDVGMMLMLPGRERTRAEWERLLGDAGFAITAMTPVPDAFDIFVIEARRRTDLHGL
jgi:hypothetical protein